MTHTVSLSNDNEETPNICNPANLNDKNISIYYQNVRGLRTKIRELYLSLVECEYDIVVLTETWLHDGISSAEFAGNFSVYRCDRSVHSSDSERGGGVLIAVRPGITCTEIDFKNAPNLEQKCVRLNLGTSTSLFICTVYLNPRSELGLYEQHSKCIEELSSMLTDSDEVLIIGDYNLPGVVWSFDDDLGCHIPSSPLIDADHITREKLIVDTIGNAGFCQLNNIPNCNGRFLDLAFVGDVKLWSVSGAISPILNVDTYHPPLILSFYSELVMLDPMDASGQFDFNRCNMHDINFAIQQANWDSLAALGDINAMTDLFYRKIYEILEAHVPRCRPHILKKILWWNKNLSTLKNRLRKRKRSHKRSPSSSTEEALIHAEASYSQAKDFYYSRYLRSIQRDLKNDPAKFWDYVRSKKGAKGLPVNLTFKGKKSSTPAEAVELCADFMKSTFTQHSDRQSTEHLRHVLPFDLNFEPAIMSVDAVENALSRVNAKKGPGPDKLSPYFIKQCASSLALPVSMLFNHSLQSGVFPAVWKMAAMVPIHKSGSVHEVENYRGVSILSCLPKVFEVFVHHALREATCNIIADCQHGFVKKRSTISNLMVYIPFISNALGKREQVDSVYIDFTKAFDRVSHTLIIDKLNRMGLPSWIIRWLQSYLNDRKAYVKHGQNISSLFNVTSGVPQGSHLGPILFILFVNDLNIVLKSNKVMFADDLKFYRVIRSPEDHHALQRDIDSLLLWCDANAMQINIKKSKVISFYRGLHVSDHGYVAGGTQLEKVDSIRDLGIIVDRTLSFKDHLASTISKARTTLGFICRNAKDFDDTDTLKMLYQSLVRSILEYGVQVWAPRQIGEMNQYEGVQRKFLRFALRRLPWNDPIRLPPYSDRLLLIRMESASSRIVLLRRMFIFDILNGNIDSPDLTAMLPIHVPSRTLRDHSFLRIPNLGWRSFHNPFYICCDLFNSVYVHFNFGLSKLTFKHRIKNIQSV